MNENDRSSDNIPLLQFLYFAWYHEFVISYSSFKSDGKRKEEKHGANIKNDFPLGNVGAKKEEREGGKKERETTCVSSVDEDLIIRRHRHTNRGGRTHRK